MKYVFDSYSDVGGRENNEDSYCAEKNGDSYLFVVADGLGGHDCGEIASTLAVEEIRHQFKNNPLFFSLENAIREANRLIMERQRESELKMKTTVVAIHVSAAKLIVANVGDSRAYLFSNDSILYQTIDHSASQLAVNIGEITPDQIRNHEDRNILTRALGVSETVKVDVAEFECDNIDRMILCSDGFWEYVLENEMCETARSSKNPDVWLFKMREKHAQRVNKGNDNNTAIVVMRKGTK